MEDYDYIILGAGASGLMLAYRMSNDTFFDDKSILIIDQEKNKGNDRTWCYWEAGDGEWDSIVTKTWNKVYFGSDRYSKTLDILPYSYKMIRSENFYSKLWQNINSKGNITFKVLSVASFDQTKSGAEVVATQREEDSGSVVKELRFKTKQLFSSLNNFEAYNFQNKYPVLQQHFLGWFVKTKTDSFDDDVATFMDFNIQQKGNTRFMYVLPIDKKTALFEYTLFSKKLLPRHDYEVAIKAYLTAKGIEDYDIIEKELGAIPMTSFKFSKLNSKHILHIGTAGGWTKASTGYTFNTTTKRTKQLIEHLKKSSDLSLFQKNSKFWYYDLLFLDVLANYNAMGSKLFASMFRKGSVQNIFEFLDEETNLYQDFKIILSVPPKRFMQSLFKRLF